MIAHSIGMDPAVTGDPSLLDPIVLHCAGGDPPLRIVPGNSRTYYVSARSVESCNRLVREALRHPETQLVSHAGGLLASLSVLENIILPVVYHQRIATSRLAELVYEEFEACEIDRSQAEALCGRAVADLGGFERRLILLVRSLLMRPAVLLMERIFEGLTIQDMERVTGFGAFYRRAVAGGALVYFELAGMPCPEITADVRAEAE